MTEQPEPPETPFQTAIRKLGGPAAAARLLGLKSRQSVSNALKRFPDRCPHGWTLRLAKASGISKSKLRPDYYPPRGSV